MLMWSDSLGLHKYKPLKSQFANNCRTKPSSFRGRPRRTIRVICKKSIVPQDYPLCKRPPEVQTNYMGFAMQILHSTCWRSSSFLLPDFSCRACPPRGRSVPIERTEVQSHAVYWQESPITGTQPSFSTTQKRYKKYKNTNLQKYKYKKRTI